MIHKAVLIEEVVKYMEPKNNATYVDATFGCGSHSLAILKAAPQCKIIAIDWTNMQKIFFQIILKHILRTKLKFICGNFASITKLFKKEKIINNVDGIIADFGTSQMQIFGSNGFSFLSDTPLDMRMSKSCCQTTAADIVNRASGQELEFIISQYGQDPNARRIANKIVQERKVKKIRTTQELTK